MTPSCTSRRSAASGRSLGPGLIGVLTLAACADTVTPPGAAWRLEVVRAPAAWQVAGRQLPDPIVLRVVNEEGEGVPGARIVWSTQDGSVMASDTSGLDGLVVGRWTLPLAPGRNVLRAAIGDTPALELVSEGRAFRADVVSTGNSGGCAIAEGDLWCWGAVLNHPPQLPGTDVPQRITDGLRLVDVAVLPYNAVCALDDQGRLLCRRINPEGGLTQLLPVDGLPALRDIDGGYGEVCGLARADSTAWCYRITTNSYPAFPSGVWQAAPDLPFTSIAARASRACGLAADGSAWCWGRQPLGDGTTNDSRVPVRVASLTRFLEVTSSDDYACGVAAGLAVHCWGTNLFLEPALVPRPVPGLSARQLSAGLFNILSVSGGELSVTSPFSFATAVVTELRGLRPLRISNNQDEWCMLDVSHHVYCSVLGRYYPNPFGEKSVRAVPPAE